MIIATTKVQGTTVEITIVRRPRGTFYVERVGGRELNMSTFAFETGSEATARTLANDLWLETTGCLRHAQGRKISDRQRAAHESLEAIRADMREMLAIQARERREDRAVAAAKWSVRPARRAR